MDNLLLVAVTGDDVAEDGRASLPELRTQLPDVPRAVRELATYREASTI